MLAALIRRTPPGKDREFLESMLLDRRKALERFERYAERAMRELPVWTVNQLAERMAAEFGEMYEVYDEVKAEEAERKRTKRRFARSRSRTRSGSRNSTWVPATDRTTRRASGSSTRSTRAART